jgi:hypothetical protein
MKLFLASAGIALAVAAVAQAEPGVVIRRAVARVTVIPEARSDVAVTVVRTNPKFPLHISRRGQDVFIDGGLRWRGANCRTMFGHRRVTVWGLGSVSYEDMPQLVIHTPMNVRMSASDAVYGVIGRADSATLANAGCGDWTVANVAGPATLRLAGSGDVRAGSARSADVRVSGSADVTFTHLDGGMTSATAGSGDIRVASLDGPLNVRIAGSGDVVAQRGQVSNMDVSIMGSGDVKFHGVAQNLTAAVAGSGDVVVGHVTGQVTKRIAGSGSVTFDK